MNINTLDLNALRVFERVAATGSFTAAARHFHRAVSSVSRQIGSLEESVGQPLLYRHTRAVALTEAGMRYYQEVRDILERLDLATEALAYPNPEPAGLLRINAPTAFGQRQIVPLLNEFQSRYPAISAELLLSDQIVDPMREAHDVTFRVGDLADSSLIGRRLAPMNYVVAASPYYLNNHTRPEQPEDLMSHNCLLYQGELGRQRWYFQSPDETTPTLYDVTGNLYSNDPESLVRAAILGQGIVLFPTWLIATELARGALIPVLTEWRAEVFSGQRDMYVLTPQRSMGVQKVSTFMTFLFDAVTPVAPWDNWRE